MSGELINEFIVSIKGFYQCLVSQRLLSALYNENNGTSGYDFVLWHFKKRLVKRVCTVGPLRFKMESAMSDHHDLCFGIRKNSTPSLI
jgi:hypothetical protein